MASFYAEQSYRNIAGIELKHENFERRDYYDGTFNVWKKLITWIFSINMLISAFFSYIAIILNSKYIPLEIK